MVSESKEENPGHRGPAGIRPCWIEQEDPKGRFPWGLAVENRHWKSHLEKRGKIYSR